MIDFHLDTHSGVPTYLQIVQQVKQAHRLGLLEPGDQLPTIRDVVSRLAINPNTVLKAYRQLELEGFARGRPGQGTFLERSLEAPSTQHHPAVGESFGRWLESAYAAGLDDDDILALITTRLRSRRARQVA